MTNTGQNKKLATFNCDSELWGKFLHRCQEQGTTATATLTQCISLYLEGSLDNFDGIIGKRNIDEQIQNCVALYLEQHLPAYIDNYLTNVQSFDLTTTKTKKSPNSHKTKLPQEPLFWTIKARAKHLGLTVSADQVLHVEMYVKDDYKERHGKLPKRELVKKTQMFVCPDVDVDILDKAINKVLSPTATKTNKP
ncbi:hypothetical protein Cri9333_4860 (plasmid) [Crinalium epipsammum PCC 9333]|uniref:Uncharacterized protein n=1 Tax=Crinalium epipsammum PCC 9333 TaxID=1173022 RepID=K9W843_9CYAN|nr:hypothetical protein [Crinalium epipsammum]AFZ15625.1 hypothetical protein Cri9333_4860 [Crinalium epipsammum PCC 9333]